MYVMLTMALRLYRLSQPGRLVGCTFQRCNRSNNGGDRRTIAKKAEQNVGLALLGVGRIGQVHIGNLISNQRVDLKWIVEQNSDLAQEVTSQYGLTDKVKIASFDNLSQVLEDDSVQSVFICTPTETHTDLIKQALWAGKHVLCEKPIAEDTTDIIACFDTAEQCDRTFMAAFNRKFDPSYRNIYNRVRGGELGKVQLIRSTFRDTPLWLGAHSLTQTFLIHDIGILCWLNDSLPESLFCMASASIKEVADKGDVDTVVVTMNFPGGTIGILDFCRYSCYGYDIRLEVFGTKGMLMMDTLKENAVKTINSNGSREPPMTESFPERFERGYQLELEHFIDVVQGKATLDMKRKYSVWAGVVMDAILESYKTGQVVHLKNSPS